MAGVFFCLGKHRGGEVDGGHVKAELAEEDREEPWTRADLEDPQLLKRSVRKMKCELARKARLPSFSPGTRKLLPVHGRVAGGAAGPVGFIFIDNCFLIQGFFTETFRVVFLNFLKSLAQKKLPQQAPRGDTREKCIPLGGLRAKTADFIMRA